ncbi:MAG: hypothetical protein EXS37_16215 [Opitutus sp.]|nr:hypothetical protein [Opitutus sp.]
MIYRFNSSRAFTFITLFTASVLATHAQTAAAPSAKPAVEEEALVLSAFTVKSEGDRGYAASETLTGSRVATKIVDLPYTVNVMTSEFLGLSRGVTQRRLLHLRATGVCHVVGVTRGARYSLQRYFTRN